ncbi:MAG: hypothetical protein HKN37_00540 [Rhodothermales bacterium]|nr:hypothetical protein [Rhodothermales bacterium]
MIRLNLGQKMTVHRGEPADGIEWAEMDGPDGYRIEVGIPWTSMGLESPRPFFGLDIHVNDNDLDRRESKLSWYSRRDNAYQTPSAFGTVAIAE